MKFQLFITCFWYCLDNIALALLIEFRSTRITPYLRIQWEFPKIEIFWRSCLFLCLRKPLSLAIFRLRQKLMEHRMCSPHLQRIRHPSNITWSFFFVAPASHYQQIYRPSDHWCIDHIPNKANLRIFNHKPAAYEWPHIDLETRRKMVLNKISMSEK